ncbi:MAG: hexitol phosphatase HxpB [Bacteroidia bacterium]|nr:hexitol phosphatase HxpB [Bacteroidia bacterium]
MINAVIFDMDGVLIDSEPFWRQAMIEVFADLGITLTVVQATETMGIRINETVAYWYDRFHWKGKSIEEVVDAILAGVIRIIREKGVIKEGVAEMMAFLQEKQIPLAVASSSATIVIDAVLDTLGIRSQFAVIKSAEKEPYGKPHPAVFLLTAEALGVPPGECLVVEDSLNGLIAAKAARMKTVVVPEALVSGKPEFVLADYKLHSLEEFTPDIWAELGGE